MIKAKTFFVSLLLLAFTTSNAIAAIKIEIKTPNFPIILGGNVGDQVSSAQLIENSLIIASTIDNPANSFSTINISSYSVDGVKQWELPISNEAISGPMTKDNSGNLYLLGATPTPAQPTQGTSPSPEAGVINPDNVQTEPTFTPTNALSNLTVWKISSSGQLLQTFFLPLNEVVQPLSISNTTNGLNIGAKTSSRLFQVTLLSDGTFSSMKSQKDTKSQNSVQEFKSGQNKLRFFVATKPIPGITNFRPKKPTPVLIQYSKSGLLKAANYFPGKVIFLLFQPNLGIIVGSETKSGYGVSIVKPLK